MDIKTTKNNRLYFNQLGDTVTVNKKEAKGINRHSSFSGFFLSIIGLSFKDSDNGYSIRKAQFII